MGNFYLNFRSVQLNYDGHVFGGRSIHEGAWLILAVPKNSTSGRNYA
jgi:hypothetical protein